MVAEGQRLKVAWAAAWVAAPLAARVLAGRAVDSAAWSSCAAPVAAALAPGLVVEEGASECMTSVLELAAHLPTSSMCVSSEMGSRRGTLSSGEPKMAKPETVWGMNVGNTGEKCVVSVGSSVLLL